ncbi:hypothetical protein HZS_6422, partial [Henneguya salminicola]
MRLPMASTEIFEPPFCNTFDSYRSWLVLLKNFSSHHKNYYDSLSLLLSPYSPVKIKKSNRNIMINFLKDSIQRPKEFADIAMFHQCLGVISFAYISSDENFVEKYKNYTKEFLLIKNHPRLVNSILIVFVETDVPCGTKSNDIFVAHAFDSNYELTPNGRSDMIRHVNDFISSIYIVLESKVTGYKSYSVNSPTIKCAIESNFETEMDARELQKVMGARHAKIIGDIYLLLGNYTKAINLYNITIDQLYNYNDNLWLGASSEGIACACHFLTHAETKYEHFFEVEVYLKRSSSDETESNIRILETLKKGTFKYLCDGLEFYRNYFIDKPLFIEYHLITFKALSLLIDVYGSINFHRKKCSIMFYYTRKTIDYKYSLCYRDAEKYLNECLAILNFKFEGPRNSAKGWQEIIMEVLMNFMSLYKIQHKMKEALSLITCETKVHESPVNINSFESDISTLFIYCPARNEVKSKCVLISMGGILIVMLRLENPLPFNLPVDITILTDPPGISIDDSEYTNISPHSTVYLTIFPKFPIISKFSIIGYASTFYGMRSVYTIPEPYLFETVEAAPLIQLDAINFTNTIKLVCHTQPSLTDITIDTYEGCIITGTLNFIPIALYPPSKVFVKYVKYDVLEVASQIKPPLTTSETLIDLKFGSNSGSSPLIIGTYTVMIDFFAFGNEKDYSIAHHLTITIRVKQHIILDSFSLITDEIDPSMSICKFTIFNTSSSDTKILFLKDSSPNTPEGSDTDPYNTVYIQKLSFENVSVSIRRIPIDNIMTELRENVFPGYFVKYIYDKIKPTWEKCVEDEALICGCLISDLSIDKQFYPIFISIPFLHMDIDLSDCALKSNQTYQWKSEILYHLNFSINNFLDFDLNSLKISIFLTDKFNKNVNFLWVGTLSKFCPTCCSQCGCVKSYWSLSRGALRSPSCLYAAVSGSAGITTLKRLTEYFPPRDALHQGHWVSGEAFYSQTSL